MRCLVPESKDPRIHSGHAYLMRPYRWGSSGKHVSLDIWYATHPALMQKGLSLRPEKNFPGKEA